MSCPHAARISRPRLFLTDTRTPCSARWRANALTVSSDGRVNGNVRSNAEDGGALSVSESGFIEGSVEVTNIVMNGTVNGDMHARERLVLGGKARVNGNVHYGVIEMAPGAVITGKLIPLGEDRGGNSKDQPAQSEPEVASAKTGA